MEYWAGRVVKNGGRKIKRTRATKVQSPYNHDPIKADKQIRLFAFTYVKGHKGVSINITHVPLNTSLDYECISYVWGDRGNTKAILCGSRIMHITENLYDALHRLRERIEREKVRSTTSQSRLFWADQICIDQTSLSEKAEQITLMSTIFPNALRVICWLGEEDDETEGAFTMLRVWRMAAEDDKLRTKLARQLLQTDEEKPAVIRARETALVQFYRRPWFQRIWIVQETFGSRNRHPVFICGARSISWQDFSRACRSLMMALVTLKTTTPATDELKSNVRLINSLFDVVQLSGVRHSQGIELSKLLVWTAHRKATDPRDMVYALLGRCSCVNSVRIINSTCDVE
jgi:hypothetical protein